MQWIAVVLMILRFLNDLRKAESKDELMLTSDLARGIGDGAIIEWIWENRDEIVAFILKLIEMFTEKPVLFGAYEDSDAADLELAISEFTKD